MNTQRSTREHKGTFLLGDHELFWLHVWARGSSVLERCIMQVLKVKLKSDTVESQDVIYRGKQHVLSLK